MLWLKRYKTIPSCSPLEKKKRKYPPQVVPNIKDSHSLLSCSSISTLNRPLPCHMRISVRAIGPLLCQLEMSCFRHHFWVSHSVRGRTAPEVRPVVFSHLAEAVQGDPGEACGHAGRFCLSQLVWKQLGMDPPVGQMDGLARVLNFWLRNDASRSWKRS